MEVLVEAFWLFSPYKPQLRPTFPLQAQLDVLLRCTRAYNTCPTSWRGCVCKKICKHSHMDGWTCRLTNFCINMCIATPLEDGIAFLQNTLTLVEPQRLAMLDLRRLVRRVLRRDPGTGSPPMSSLFPVADSSSSATAVATPPATQQPPHSPSTGEIFPCNSSSNQAGLSPVETAGFQSTNRPFATHSTQHIPAATSSPAVPTQHQRTPTNSTVGSRFSVWSASRSDTNDSRHYTLRPFVTRDLQREARRQPLRAATKRESYPTYNLEWERLREWLMNTFPGCDFGTGVAVRLPTRLVTPLPVFGPGSTTANRRLTGH